jgi:hypothetical protein
MDTEVIACQVKVDEPPPDENQDVLGSPSTALLAGNSLLNSVDAATAP